MKFFLLTLIMNAFCFSTFAQEAAKTTEDKEAAYTKTITVRAQKIVATLGLTDTAKAARVTTTLIRQYRNLNAVYEARDEQINKVKQSGADKKSTDSLVNILQESATQNARKLHEPFIASLSKELNKDQVTQIKDGMTFNVLSVTYKALNNMIPTLKPAEKEQIMVWLTEAREYAMDAESSDKKHWWFGKYKGRINNYLAAQGYDLQKERKDWEARLKATEDQKKVNQNQP